MIIEEIRAIKGGTKELRQFGVTIAAALCLIGGWLWWKESQWDGYLFVAAAAVLLPTLLFPTLLKPFHRFWMVLGLCMGLVVTGVLMVVLFYLVVTPIGLLMRLRGMDPLKRSFDREASSYWIPRDAGTADKKNYERQF
jgi:uncharacterized membrane protein (DUF2068 family)